MSADKGIEFLRRNNDLVRKASNATREENRFINNYRNIIDDEDSPQKSVFFVGNDLSNEITFRNARVGEKTGLQRISLIGPKGKKEDVFLIVPERESVGYGNIRGWGGPTDKDTDGEPRNMPLSRKAMSETAKGDMRLDGNTGAKSFHDGLMAFPTILGGVVDIVGGNAVSNNITKNKNSNYTGEDKAVGLGTVGQSNGQIFGMVSSDGEMLSPSETKYFLENLDKNGYKGVAEIEQPTRVQEHNGPAYVPGDILLGMLGLQPNRGSVGYTFKTPGSNEQYRTFIKNLRSSGGK